MAYWKFVTPDSVHNRLIALPFVHLEVIPREIIGCNDLADVTAEVAGALRRAAFLVQGMEGA